MKTKTTKSIAAVLAASTTTLLTGCLGLDMAKWSRELGKDPSTVAANVTSPVYGTVKFVRTNPGEGSKVTVSPDGTVTVERK